MIISGVPRTSLCVVEVLWYVIAEWYRIEYKSNSVYSRIGLQNMHSLFFAGARPPIDL